MKRTLLPITLVTLLSIFIYSCSSGDDDSAPPSVIQTPTPEPDATQYTLPSLSMVSSSTSIFTKSKKDTLTFEANVPGGFNKLEINSDNGDVEIVSQPEMGATSGEIKLTYSPQAIVNVDYTRTIAGSDNLSIKLTDKNDLTLTDSYTLRTQPEPIYKDYLKSSHDLQHHSLYKIDFGRIRIINGKANTYSCNGTRPELNYISGLDQDCLTAAAVFDINLDGYEDFILPPTFCFGPQENFSTQKIEYEVYMYQDGEFILNSNDIFSNTIPKSYLGRKAFAGDFDGDGDGDAFIACTGVDQQPYPREIEPSILLINEFNENGKIRVVEINEYSSSHEASSADIDNDGDLDIFSAGYVNPDRFVGYHNGLLLNDGNGNFNRSNNITYYDNKITDNIRSIFDSVTSSEIIDIDNDGYNDILYGGNEALSTLGEPTTGSVKILWGTQDFTFDTLDKTQIPIVSGFGVITDLDSYDLDNDGTKEIILLRTGDNLDEDGQLFSSGGEFSNIFIGQSFYYGGYYIQIVKIVDREAIDVTLDFISDNFNRTPNRMWSDCDYDSSWIRWLTIGDYDNNGQIDLYTPLFYEVGPGEKDFKRWEWSGSKFIKVSP